MQLIATSSVVLASILVVANVANAWWLFSGEPSASSQLVEQKPLQAVANFDMDGVKGTFKFTQKSSTEPTTIEYDISGLKGNNRLYHVHVRPVPAFDANKVRNNVTLISQLCGDPAVGGHHNPHNIVTKLPPKSAPFDKYETGDLSGKHGPLLQVAGHDDHYHGTFTDDKLPMSGADSILGRSVVIHKNDTKRWVCASINVVP